MLQTHHVRGRLLRVSGQNSQKEPSLWRPLRGATFRNVLLADVSSDVGTFMQGVAAAWLMVSLHAGPLYVALIQTASALPFFLLALPAGAIGDIVDRRKLILCTEAWMAIVAIVLACLAFYGSLSPLLLLVLTFALSAGRRSRKSDLASGFTRAGFEGRPACRSCSQWHRVQPCPRDWAGTGWGRDRRRKCGHRLPR